MRLFDKNRSTEKDKKSNFVNLKKGKIMAGKLDLRSQSIK